MYSCAHLRAKNRRFQQRLRSVQGALPLVRLYRSAGLKSKTDTLAVPRNRPGEQPFLAQTGGFPFPAGDGTMGLIFDGPAPS